MWLPSLELVLPESGQTGPGDSLLMSTPSPTPCLANHHHHHSPGLHATCSGSSKPCWSQIAEAGGRERGLQATLSWEGTLKHNAPR